MKKLSSIFLFCLLSGQVVWAQITYVGKLDLNNKEKLFSLNSGTDSLKVTIDNKNIEFGSEQGFQLINLKGNAFELICNGDTIVMNEKSNQIEYSSGLSLTMAKKKAHQLVLNDKVGKTVLDANYTLKNNIAVFNISIFDAALEKELLSYSTYYLFTQSANEANFVPVYMFFMY